ncbi:MAG: 16S rRNA (cytidine(1402)-2'-O)-methyltransferase [Candidatus Paceibacterota bacterium]
MLFVVGTPIGNLGDISERARSVLSDVDVILAEDTRVTRKLLSHFDIHTPLERFDAHTEDRIDPVIKRLTEGDSIALVSDAGTPGISDPGSRLIRRVQEEVGTDHIRVIPGPSSLTAALSISGLPASDFLFLGFLPRKKGRETLFKEIASVHRSVVFFESPHRIEKTLASLREHIEDTRLVVIARELTKIYEEVVRGSLKEVQTYFADHPDHVRGEFVVMIEGV